MIACQTCHTQAAKPAADWAAEDFLRQDAKGKRYVMSLYLCGRCKRFVTATFGAPRTWLSKQLPPGLIAVSHPTRPARARATR